MVLFCINIQFTFPCSYQHTYQQSFIIFNFYITYSFTYFYNFCFNFFALSFQHLFINCKYKNFLAYIGLINQ